MLLSALLAAHQPTLQLTLRYENDAQAELQHNLGTGITLETMTPPGWHGCIATA